MEKHCIVLNTFDKELKVKGHVTNFTPGAVRPLHRLIKTKRMSMSLRTTGTFKTTQ